MFESKKIEQLQNDVGYLYNNVCILLDVLKDLDILTYEKYTLCKGLTIRRNRKDLNDNMLRKFFGVVEKSDPPRTYLAKEEKK